MQLYPASLDLILYFWYLFQMISTPSNIPAFEVVAAAIFVDRSIYCFKRGIDKYSYLSEKFEFPGGKIEIGENDEDALKRELAEEIGVEVYVDEKIITVNHSYPDFDLIMHCYRCRILAGTPKLQEHQEVRLIPIEELEKLEWLEADLPVVEKLMNDY